MIRSLFLDIDGTLVSIKTHRIPASTADALRQAKARGVGIFISTGRPLQIITNLGDIADLIDGYITTNGALCLIGGETVCCNPIRTSDARAIITDAEANGTACLAIGERDVVVINPDKAYEDTFVKGLNVTNLDLSVPLSRLEGQRILQFSPFITAAHEATLMAGLEHCTSARWHQAFCDITSLDADKGKGLAAMAARLGLDISETMAFGDGANDIPIIRTAGVGVAMGNAGPDVKAAADYTTTPVDDDGIRNALVRYGVI